MGADGAGKEEQGVKFPWRKVLWIYRSAAGGWCIYVFKRGFHVLIERIPDPSLSDLVIRALQSEALRDNLTANNALLARLQRHK